MSLTLFLTDKEVKEKFTQEFQLPNFNLEKEIVAPPITNHFMLVGTAFDYLLRFYLKRLNPSAIARVWVAEAALNSGSLLQAFIISEAGKSYYQRDNIWKIVGKGDKNWNMSPCLTFDGKAWSIQRVWHGSVEQAADCDLLKSAQEIVEKAHKNYSSFLSSGQLTDELIKSALLLAQLDPILRSHYIDKNIGIIDDKDIEDLRKLISLVSTNTFKASSVCLLNPTFGEASKLVGGADADLVIDNALIDIKTTKFLKLDRKMFNQLVGYYILYRIGGVGEPPRKQEIKKLGIYYPRFSEVYTFDISDIINENKLADFISWFKAKAKSTFGKK